MKEEYDGAAARDDEQVPQIPQLERRRLQEGEFDAVEEVPCLGGRENIGRM